MKKLKGKTFKSAKTSKDDDFNEINEDRGSSKKWHEELHPDPKDFKPVTEGALIELKDEAKKLHDAESAAFKIKNSKNTNYKWMKSILIKGTVSDKIAAQIVFIQDNPLYNLDALNNLINSVKVAKKRECVSSIQNLTDLFLNDLLKPNLKLKPFHQRPLSTLKELSSGNNTTRKKYLIYWYFEDQLKELYTSFVLALNNVAHDTLDANKEKAIGAMFKLLVGNPEQEKNLLSFIVNKLGDPSQKVSSKAIYCLGQILNKHPNMQGVVLTEVEKLLFRPNVPPRAQYYGICFLSQFYLSHEASFVAKRLIDVYFTFFKSCIKKGDVDSRMMSALLMGVNRAFPYAKMDVETNSEHIETMYRVVHIANFNIGLHALSLLYQVSGLNSGANDRFYSALYKKLLDPKIFTTTHQAMLLNLVYKALCRDTETNRICTFIKRLLQLAIYTQPNFSCGILFLVSQVIGKKPESLALDLKKTSITTEDDDDDEEKYMDVKEEPADEMINPSNENKTLDQNRSDEVIDLNKIDINHDTETLNQDKPTQGWYHCQADIKKENKKCIYSFRPLSRNPLYAGGEFCTFTELNQLKCHFHPTVSLFASQILNGETIKYSGDPLKDFTVIRFLDRFVFKNPKKKEEIAKLGSHPTFGRRKNYTPIGVKSLSVNSTNYLKEKQENIPVDELFMYMFLQKRRENKNDDDDDSDLDSVASEEFEELLEKMAGKANVEEDEELDFIEDIEESKKKMKQKKKIDDELELEEGQIENNDLSDLENDDISSIEDEDGSDIDEDGSDIDEDVDLSDELSDGLSDEDLDIGNNKKLESEESKRIKKIKKKYSDTDFAPAEEFAELLEEEGTSKVKPGGSNVYSNQDKSDVKQLTWEGKRNHWLKGKKQHTKFTKTTNKQLLGKRKHNIQNKGPIKKFKR